MKYIFCVLSPTSCVNLRPNAVFWFQDKISILYSHTDKCSGMEAYDLVTPFEMVAVEK